MTMAPGDTPPVREFPMGAALLMCDRVVAHPTRGHDLINTFTRIPAPKLPGFLSGVTVVADLYGARGIWPCRFELLHESGRKVWDSGMVKADFTKDPFGNARLWTPVIDAEIAEEGLYDLRILVDDRVVLNRPIKVTLEQEATP